MEIGVSVIMLQLLLVCLFLLETKTMVILLMVQYPVYLTVESYMDVSIWIVLKTIMYQL